MTPLYTATAHATGDGRNGHTRSDDGILDLDVRIPKEMGGAGGATNPEQLFAAGYAACFHSALKFVAGQEKLDVTDTEVSASVGIGPLPSGGFGLAVELDVHTPNLDRETARGAGREGAPGLPVLERDTRQHRGEAHRRVTRPASSNTTSAARRVSVRPGGADDTGRRRGRQKNTITDVSAIVAPAAVLWCQLISSPTTAATRRDRPRSR